MGTVSVLASESYALTIEITSEKADLFSGPKQAAITRQLRALLAGNSQELGRGVGHLARNITIEGVEQANSPRVVHVHVSVRDVPPNFVASLNEYVRGVAVKLVAEAPAGWCLQHACLVVE